MTVLRLGNSWFCGRGLSCGVYIVVLGVWVMTVRKSFHSLGSHYLSYDLHGEGLAW